MGLNGFEGSFFLNVHHRLFYGKVFSGNLELKGSFCMRPLFVGFSGNSGRSCFVLSTALERVRVMKN